MSTSNDLAKLLRRAGVDPKAYNIDDPVVRFLLENGEKIPFNPPPDFHNEPPKRSSHRPLTPIPIRNKKDDEEDEKRKKKPFDLGPLQQEGEGEKIPFNPPPDFHNDPPKRSYNHPLTPIPLRKKKDDEEDEKKRNKSLDIGPLQEYHDPKSRSKAIIEKSEDEGLKLIYQWVKSNTINFEEFEDLLAEIVKKIRPKL